jgi:hypothetical protein
MIHHQIVILEEYFFWMKEYVFFKTLKHKIYIQRLLKDLNHEMCELILQHLPYIPSLWKDNDFIP